MKQKWSGQTGGTHWMQRALVSIIRHTDIRVVYGAMHFWLIWYILVRPIPRQGIYRYHRLRGRTRWQAAVDVYRSFYHFGQAILDRFAVYAGCPFEVQVENKELYYRHMQSKEGLIMLFSHVGNTEMAGYFMATPDKPMHIIAYGGESPVVLQNKARELAKNNIDMIIVQPNDMSHIYRINEVLQQGDVLTIAADRRMGDSSTLPCTMLGAEAQLPAGPFQICVTMHQPVLLVFAFKEGLHAYHIYTEQLDVNYSLPRREQAQDLANRFAQRVEAMALTHPYQWFNMYDFWA
ncbi:MAG: hypothetical protein J5704_03490 [Paludibacteraceae bacterium]|nr:hypothetical protein [Paludibacteraceae bacterium]